MGIKLMMLFSIYDLHIHKLASAIKEVRPLRPQVVPHLVGFFRIDRRPHTRWERCIKAVLLVSLTSVKTLLQLS